MQGQDIWMQAIDGLASQGWWSCDQLLPEASVQALYQYALSLRSQQLFQAAKIGKDSSKHQNQDIRSDEIHWIDDWDQHFALKDYQQAIQTFSCHIRSQFYLNCSHFEAHFAHYPAGSFYKKHVDQHKNTGHRKISCILYLSPWKNDNAGELMLYPENQTPQCIAPIAGRFVTFISKDLVHEVLLTRGERMAITGWLRDDHN